MSIHKHLDKICCIVLAVTLVITVLFMNAEKLGIQKTAVEMGYENRLFDTNSVHTIDIVMDDWDSFIETCTNEEYSACTVIIDGEAYKNVAIRAKGNTSLTQVESYGNNRYSFKIEFDHYDSTKTYYGLDKLCLNNIIQDNTYMKDYLTYQMMAEMGVASPLCSYVNITVNGETWGLYLAVEGVEESFLQRNYGNDYGELYKPDSMSMGGGRGNGKDFEMDEWEGMENENGSTEADSFTVPDNPTNGEDTTAVPEQNNNVSDDMQEEKRPDDIQDGQSGQQPGNEQDGQSGQQPRNEQDGQSGQQPGNIQDRQMPDGMTPPELPDGGKTDGENPNGEIPDSAAFGNDGQSQQGDGNAPESDGQSQQGDGNASESDGQSQQGDGNAPESSGQMPKDSMQGRGNGRGGSTMGSEDVLLKYINDEIDSYSNIFDSAKTNISDSDKERLIASLKQLNNGENLTDTVDIEKVICYFVVHNFVLNFDSYTGSMIHNYYLYEKDGQMEMIPWDYNLAFGGFESAGGATNLVNYPIDSPVSGGDTEDRPMLAWIFESEEYTERYHQYFAEFISKYFDSGKFVEMIDSVKALISPYVEADPTKFCTYEEFVTGIDTLKEFCLLRAESITGQLNGTIGSTSDTQREDTLIDAGDIEISDMGSMNHSMGGEMDKNQDGNMQEPQNGDGFVPEMPQSEAAGETVRETENDNSDEQTQYAIKKQDKGDMPEDMNKKEDMSGRISASSMSVYIWVCISCGVLIFGILFAMLFKRRR